MCKRQDIQEEVKKMTVERVMLANEITERELPHYINNGWICEIKLDGTRCKYVYDGREGHLINRRGFCYDEQFPEILAELNEKFKDVDVVLDGELVLFDENGLENFHLLTSRCSTKNRFKRELLSRYRVEYYVFDLMCYDESTVNLPLTKRKELLKSLFAKRYFKADDRVLGLVKMLESTENIRELWERAKAEGWEGLLIKAKNSRYVHNRSNSWLKLKNKKVDRILFDGYEVNNAGITLTNKQGTRVQCGGQKAVEVRRQIDERGFTEQEVHYLRKTDRGKFFQPVIIGCI